MISMPLYIFISVIIAVGIFYLIVNRILNLLDKNLIFLQMEKDFVILEQAKHAAYTKIYREIIFKFLQSGYRIGEKEFEIVKREYLTCVFLLMGDTVKRDLLKIYGDMDSLCAVLLNELVIRIEDDEVSHFERYAQGEKE